MYGNTSGDYSAKNLNTGLRRSGAASAFYFTVPGPKMIWQFGEYGYDISIDENGRTGEKPIKWDYLDDPNRKNLFDTYRELISLRAKYDVFTKGAFSWKPSGNSKSIHISNSDTSVVILGNFDVETTNINPEFQHAGTWYDFFTGGQVTVEDVNAMRSFAPGEFHIYTDKKLHMPNMTIVLDVENELNKAGDVYPNPTTDILNLPKAMIGNQSWRVIDITGKTQIQGKTNDQLLNAVDVSALKPGIYNLLIETAGQRSQFRFVKSGK